MMSIPRDGEGRITDSGYARQIQVFARLGTGGKVRFLSRGNYGESGGFCSVDLEAM